MPPFLCQRKSNAHTHGDADQDGRQPLTAIEAGRSENAGAQVCVCVLAEKGGMMKPEETGDGGEKEPDSANPVGEQEATLRMYTKTKIMRCCGDEFLSS